MHTQHSQNYDISRNRTEMYLLTACFLLLAGRAVHSSEQTEHRDFQYNSVVDPMTGRYNFAYDTGNDNDIAHTMHMQYRDANGIVRGRYGYTDPHGKLRVVEYEAGPDGFIARGDVGPDQSPHDNAPETRASPIARYSQEEDLQLVPRPVQMAGWDPLQNPMGQPVSSGSDGGSSSQGDGYGFAADAGSSGLDGYATTNNTNIDEVKASDPKVEPYDERYPRISFSTNENAGGRELESLSAQTSGDENKSEMIQDYPVAAVLTVNNIDVNPDDIRVAANQGPVGRSADGDRPRSSRALPYSYRNYRRQTHDHDAEMAIQGTGYRVVYRPSHDHYNEQYYRRQTHDHDAEKKLANNRQTHDHDAERRYYVNRQTHDHDAEKRYYAERQTHDHDAERRYYVNNRQTHDHDAERRYYVNNRQTHDHDAERRYYVNNRQTHDHDAERRVYYRNNYPYRRRIYYRDSHSMVPHEHYSDVYQNDRSHQHSDVHLYGRSQNLEVPATTRPRQLKYIPADKYHSKYYYWTD